MRTVLVALGLALSVSCASAATKATFGNYDCGQWFVKNQPARSWLLGLLSGFSLRDHGPIDVLDRLNSAEQAFLWMDNYCKTNPLKHVSDGAIDLYLELANRK